MSSDGYFDDDFNDPELLEAANTLEAAHFSPKKPPPRPATLPLAKQPSDSFDASFDMDDIDFAQIDAITEDAYSGRLAQPVAGPSGLARTGSKQMTLFGDVLQEKPKLTQLSRSGSGSALQRTKSTPRNPFGQQAPKTKVWDQTAWAKSGWKKPQPKGKGRSFDDEDGEDEEAVEFEQFPAPVVPGAGPPPAMKLVPDLLEVKHWIYPLNKPKRDYQYNIVKHCLFENTLVALPTGLGKTFIAGVVMLNYYRWFPDGKIVFVAPSKPLVAQQIEACHKTCGISGHDAAELTGNVPRAQRAKAWREKRVFYMTPQTLMNDLISSNCEVRDIVLIVVDEAHKGTGDYAYAQAIRYLMAKNGHFRVLALTATPGGTPDAVQAIIDSLHISHIEIRDDNSLDLKEYIHEKVLKQHILKMSEDINKVKDLLVALMNSIIQPLKNRGVIPGHTDVATMHPFRTTAISGEIMGGRGKKDQMWALQPLNQLGSLARAMGYLIEGTMGMCYSCLSEINKEPEPVPGKKQQAGNKLRANPLFKAVMQELEAQRARGFSAHPKMERLKALILQHFGDGHAADDTRAIVFVTFREAVDEIVAELNKEHPLIRASRFVGQANTKSGNKGFAQSEQLEVIQKFTKGEYNVLVSTAIGEEGLDIGQVDLIMCYDAQKTPIRMLQRVGRTGRQRTGIVHVLLAENREEHNWDKAKATHKDVNRSIVRGDQLELYADVDRLIPAHIKPECLERKMDCIEYVREGPKKRASKGAGSPAAKGTKRKRNDDIGRNMPEGVHGGFVSVAELLVKGAAKKKRKKNPVEFDPLAGEDDDTDMELESGILGPRRTVSTSAASSAPKQKKMRRSATTAEGKQPKASSSKKKKKKASKSTEDAPSTSQFSQKGMDDSDDMELEQGVINPLANTLGGPSRRRSPSPPENSPKYWSSSPEVPLVEVIDIASDTSDCAIVDGSPGVRSRKSNSTPRSQMSLPNSSPGFRPQSPKYWTSSPETPPPQDGLDAMQEDSPSRRSGPPARKSTSNSPRHGKAPERSASPGAVSDTNEKSMAWLVDEDEDPDILIVDSSPLLDRRKLQPSDSDIEIVEEPVPYVPPSRKGKEREHSASTRAHFEADVSVEIMGEPTFVRPPDRYNMHHDLPSDTDLSVEIVENPDAGGSSSRRDHVPHGSPSWLPSNTPPLRPKGRRNFDMQPPQLPARLVDTSPMSDYAGPEPTYPVRAIGKQPKRFAPLNQSSSPSLDMPPPSQRRLQRKKSHSPSPNAADAPPRKLKKRKERDPIDRHKHNPWIETEAAHSGDEVSEGSSQADEPESESDRLFLQGLPETQASSSYDQTLAYRQSLFTQPPARGRVPAFARGPRRPGVLGREESSRRRAGVSSSPPREDSMPDEYALGSFIVGDEDISYAADSSFEIPM